MKYVYGNVFAFIFLFLAQLCAVCFPYNTSVLPAPHSMNKPLTSASTYRPLCGLLDAVRNHPTISPRRSFLPTSSNANRKSRRIAFESKWKFQFENAVILMMFGLYFYNRFH